MAYLRRRVKGGGFISREVGVGRKRIDLLVEEATTASGRNVTVLRA